MLSPTTTMRRNRACAAYEGVAASINATTSHAIFLSFTVEPPARGRRRWRRLAPRGSKRWADAGAVRQCRVVTRRKLQSGQLFEQFSCSGPGVVWGESLRYTRARLASEATRRRG